jgi:hypothetical protein
VSLPLDVTLPVLAAAIMHAAWNAIAKAGASKLLDVTGIAVAGGVLSALVLPLLPLPERAARPWLAASLLLHFFISLRWWALTAGVTCRMHIR